MLETRRERIVVFGGAPAIALLLYILFQGNGAAPAAPVAPPVQTAAPSRPQAPAPAPAPPASTPQLELQPQPQPSLEGITLHGIVTASAGRGSAIVGYRDGSQRLVLVGQPVVPGFTLSEVARDRVTLAGAGGGIELRLDGRSVARADAALQALPGAPPTRGGSAASSPAQQRAEALQYRVGLAPRRANGRTTGYTFRPDNSLPLLQRAGLRAGDVLVAVNGQTFDSDERVLDLPREIAGSYSAEFEFERNGRRMRTSLPINPRK